MASRQIVQALKKHWPLLLAVGIGAGALVYIFPILYFAIGITYLVATSRPLNWDVVEPRGSDCQLTDAPRISNHRGLEAVLRFANCPGYFAQGTAYNVVFVHVSGHANERSNLAFQYAPGFEGYKESPPPRIVWKGPTLLEISVPGVIDVIKIQKDEVSGVRLMYRLGKQVLGTTLFQR